MFKTIAIIAVIVLAAFLVIGSVHNKGVKDNYGKPLGKVTNLRIALETTKDSWEFLNLICGE